MKKLLFILSVVLAVFIATGSAFAEDNGGEWVEPDEVETICPKTRMSNQNYCFTCHTTPNFKVKQADPREGLQHPGWLILKDGKFEGYFLLKDMDSDRVDSFYEYLYLLGVKKATVEIFSPGGSMMQAWRIISIINQYNTIETTTAVKGYAASAGFMIMVAGNKRLVAPNSLLMWHELVSFKLFDISSPSDKEEQARVLRFFQDNLNSWLASKSDLTKKEIDVLIRKKEFWITGADAVRMGFADGFLK